MGDNSPSFYSLLKTLPCRSSLVTSVRTMMISAKKINLTEEYIFSTEPTAAEIYYTWFMF